MLNSKLGYLP